MAGLRGKYRLGDRIGGGGMAEVYEATLLGAEGFARPVAIKRMLPRLSATPTFGSMFVSEARIASLLQHPNIVSVLDFDRDDDGRYFLVMDLVRGVDLRRLASTGPLPPAITAFVGAEVLHGLSYAHELEDRGRHLGIVHRDVSPHNVMIGWDGVVKLVDFGIAKVAAATGASMPGVLKGKIPYMSPEQARGKKVDGRSDVFSVGVMMHELLTGRRLFAGGTEHEVLARVLNQPIPSPRQVRPEVPVDLDRVLMRMLERDRKARFLTAHAAMEALLASESMSPRGQLELRELLQARFPGEAPVRRADSEPSFLLQKTTSPEGRPPPAAVERRVEAGATLTAPSTPRSRRPRGARSTSRRRTTGAPRGALWIGAAAVVAVAAVITAVLVSGGGTPRRGDAGVLAAAPASAGDARADDPAGDAAAPEPDPTGAPGGAPSIAGGGDAARPDRPSSTVDGAHRSASGAETETDRRRTGRRVRAGANGSDAATAAAGILRVRVAPWARVHVDGTAYGETPVRISLPPGQHRVRLVNPHAGKRETVEVTIVPARTHWLERDWTD